MGLPTPVLFKGGREVGRLVGLRNEAAIKQAVDQVTCSPEPQSLDPASCGEGLRRGGGGGGRACCVAGSVGLR